MSIRKNLIADYAHKDLAFTIARWVASDARKKLTPVERRVALQASARASLRWAQGGYPEPGAGVTPQDIAEAWGEMDATERERVEDPT